MSDEQFIVNDGDGAKLVPVETKDHTNDPLLVPIVKKESIGTTEEFAKNVSPVQETKKRGRPRKTETKISARNWHCSSCKETFSDTSVMKMGAGHERWAVFCPMCQRSFGFQDQAVLDKVDSFIKNNPTGKSDK